MNMTQEHSLSPRKQGRVDLELVNPPVVESSVGFHFQKIERWHLLHQGLLWGRFRSKYPKLEILPTVLEPSPQQRIQLDLNSPILRTGFVDSTRTQLVQIQDGLFLHNWRKSVELPGYKRFDTIREFLRQDWETFRTYLQEESLKDPEVSRCEMSYFNHLVRNEDWNDFSDLAKTFRLWNGIPEQGSYGNVQMAAFNVLYQLDTGSVGVLVQPGIRSSDGKEIIQFTLTSSSQPKSSSEEELFRCLDECHENAQRAFVDFTTERARERWT
jgi:uncharacterized protein (TIGR04255 family)